ncbi:MAG: hypothetical protein OQL19_10250 [Gammaproteobacteria bacterium]|nr:hypothetical protein [Gammaproteobacteria bacterium]
MMPANREISYSGEEIINILKEIELILISLHNMGTYYMDKDDEEYRNETTRFIDEWKVTHKLATVRAVLTKRFDLSIGDDDMDDLERAMESIKCWSKKGDNPIP